MHHQWKPSVTVAAIVEKAGLFLLVEEETSDGLRLNQPAGHLERQESLLQAVVRETLEETAYNFTPTALIGVYLARAVAGVGVVAETGSGADRTYLRFAFTGELGSKEVRPLDRGIVRTLWLSRDEIAACPERHRSPALLQGIDDYLRGQRMPLEILFTHSSITGSGQEPTWGCI
jgi:8-oxo-dGTP pyrophosphatase MutT (NUDIX family)